MTYESGETITLSADVTKDLADSLDNLTVTVSIKIAATGGRLVDDAAMYIDLDDSTIEKKVYKYIFEIPETISGQLCWWVTVETITGYKTIAKSSITVVSSTTC
jgi:hypothetical protein